MRNGLLTGFMLPLLAALQATAQEYHVRSYTVDDGLPSAHVRAITQDAEGQVWFATRSGIASYDGFEWTTYNLTDGLTWADQFALRWGTDGSLWSVGAISPFKVYLLEGERWHEQPGPTDLPARLEITAFEVIGDRQRNILAVGTRQGGLLINDGGTWRRLTTADGLPSNEIRGLVVHDSTLIVATSQGLIRLGTDVANQPLAPAARDIRGLTQETSDTGADRIWLVGEDWIGHFEADRFTRLGDRLPLRLMGLVSAAADRRGGLYFGGPGAFYHFHPEDGLTTLGTANGILTDGVTALQLDREDNLWIGTERGASKLVSRQFARYAAAQGLLDDEVTAVIERRPGEIVFGHRGGISILQHNNILCLPLLGESNSSGHSPNGHPRDRDRRGQPDRVRDFAVDHHSHLWLAVGTLGLARLDLDNNLRWFDTADGLTGAVNSVRLSSDGHLWVATDNGLRVHRNGIFVAPRDEASPLRVRRIFETADGDLLLAAATGLAHLVDGEWQTWTCSEGASCNSVFAAQEIGGKLLVGTSAGLYQVTDDQLAPSSIAGLDIDRPIYFMVQDSLDRTWFGTDNGVLRWDGAKLAHFTVEDGLAGRETHRAAGWVDSRGTVWVGTESGATAYTEGRPGPPRGPPLVALRSIDASGRPLPLNEPQRLGHDEDDLVFRFNAVSLLDEERILISSRLEGFEGDWLPPYSSPNREVRYTNLPPGEYIFHLRAANAEGTWSEPVSSVPVIISRPFWQRTWFYLLLATVVGAALYAGSSYLQQRKYSRRLEAEVAERVAQLSTEKERLLLTLRNIGDGVITVDAKGRVELINPTAEQITGWPRTEAVGQPLADVLPLYEATVTADSEAAVPLPAMPLPAVPLPAVPLPGPNHPDLFDDMRSLKLVPSTGDPRLVEVAGSPILKADGGYSGHVLAVRDITEKTQLESELAKGQKLEALGLLAGGIAHDFNNLLTVLLGNLSLLGVSGQGQSQRARHLVDAEKAVLRARDLTQQLLTFSRGGSPVRKAASISEVIHDSASFIMSGSKVRCNIDLAAELWVVEIDSGQISQVINNLLINAIQAMPDGGTVHIAGRNTTDSPPPLAGGRYIVIDIVDHGVGIPASHQSRIFDPYFSTKQEGRGLGLASAYSIARKHEGLLTVRSNPGEGASFSLYLPASSVEIRQPQPTTTQSPERGGRILIMDDDDAVRRVTGLIVEQLGFEVAHARDGQEAIASYRGALAEQRPYDVVLMDLTIPGGMGGKEALARLRDLDPEITAVVMSGYSNDPVLAHYRDYGFSGVINKPFKATDLTQTLNDLTRGEHLTGKVTESKKFST